MGTAKGETNTTAGAASTAQAKASSSAEPDQYPDGTRLGHYVLGKLNIITLQSFSL
jgi:hypothetical protein